MLRILVNRLATLGQLTGIGYYTAQLVHHLSQMPDQLQVREFPEGFLWRLSKLWHRAPNGKAVADTDSDKPAPRPSLSQRVKSTLINFAREQARHYRDSSFQSLLKSGKVDLYHETNHLATETDFPTITTIHDLSALLHPEWHPLERAQQFERDFERTLSQSRHFITISDFTRREMIQRLGVDPSRITPVYIGMRNEVRRLEERDYLPVLQKWNLTSGYFLHVGTLEPRKNLLMLLRAWCSLSSEIRSQAPLVLAGGWGWKCEEIADFLDEKGQAAGVIHLGYVPDEDLVPLYNAARAVVLPSFYEGMGLPALEMAGCGGAVIASTAHAVREVSPPNSVFLPAEDEDGWRDALQRATLEPEWLQELKVGAEQHANEFTWQRCASETVQAYHQALGRRVDEARRAA